ncbi:Phage-associated protein [Streptococcus sp. DD10]|uniref:phage tail protein n=1 Tax=Streptococcus sp. DD10 TaxID=1777878 RepID=UPI00079CB407|nr:phage tail protein [Streptococcus sp. DD10]KXT73201.1 Phage-associated protein [Streptococcus sp. DD10]
MAFNYLVVNGFSTARFTNSVVMDFGDIKLASPRFAEKVTLHGVNGSYNLPDGAFDSYDRTIKLFIVRYADALTLLEKFQAQDNVLEFSYQTDSVFYADLLEGDIKPKGKGGWEVTVKLNMQPFRYVKNPPDITLTGNGSLTNPGTVFSEPVIVLEGSGEVSLTIGKQVMQLTLDTKATIDCRHKKQNVYDKIGYVRNTIRKRGPFFEIPVGISGVAVTGNIQKITIKGNWRYKV